jgi:protein-S-isoprenylcysteine O-methyltransferase Ste14
VKLLSLVATLALIAVIFLLYHWRAIVAATPLGMGVQVAAFLLMAWARITLGLRSFHATANATEGGLVTTGPYRFWRHPIYSAILYFFGAAVLTHWSLRTALCGAVVLTACVTRMIAEERMLVVRYPEYADYARRTRRVIPFIV